MRQSALRRFSEEKKPALATRHRKQQQNQRSFEEIEAYKGAEPG